MEPTRYDSLGLGISILDSEAVVLLTTGTAESPIVVTIPPETAVHISMSIAALAAEATALQGEIAKMSTEELTEYLEDVKRRNASWMN